MMKQLECRIVVTYKPNQKVGLGMYDPLNSRYEPLGEHSVKEIDDAVENLKASIERAGHRLTFCTRTVG